MPNCFRSPDDVLLRGYSFGMDRHFHFSSHLSSFIFKQRQKAGSIPMPSMVTFSVVV